MNASPAYVPFVKVDVSVTFLTVRHPTHARASRKELGARSTHCAHRSSLAAKAGTRTQRFYALHSFFFTDTAFPTPFNVYSKRLDAYRIHYIWCPSDGGTKIAVLYAITSLL